MKPLLLALLLLGFAASAQAGGAFNECRTPSAVPEDVFDTILEQADVDFGNLPENVCNSITKKGVSTCKAQVKAAAQCYKRAAAAVYDISLKQCNQLETSEDRAGCKESAKSAKQFVDGIVGEDQETGLETCEGDFAGGLSANCNLGPA